MKPIIRKSMLLMALSAILFSFTSSTGGEGFEIYLNNKMLLQQYGNQMKEVKNLQLTSAGVDDQLTIKYHHCGKVAKNRIVTIKDGQNNILKEWRFADVETPLGGMNCSVKEIFNLKKGNINTVNLYYSSSELPNGRLLAAVNINRSKQVNP